MPRKKKRVCTKENMMVQLPADVPGTTIRPSVRFEYSLITIKNYNVQ